MLDTVSQFSYVDRNIINEKIRPVWDYTKVYILKQNCYFLDYMYSYYTLEILLSILYQQSVFKSKKNIDDILVLIMIILSFHTARTYNGCILEDNLKIAHPDGDIDYEGDYVFDASLTSYLQDRGTLVLNRLQDIGISFDVAKAKEIIQSCSPYLIRNSTYEVDSSFIRASLIIGILGMPGLMPQLIKLKKDYDLAFPSSTYKDMDLRVFSLHLKEEFWSTYYPSILSSIDLLNVTGNNQIMSQLYFNFLEIDKLVSS